MRTTFVSQLRQNMSEFTDVVYESTAGLRTDAVIAFLHDQMEFVTTTIARIAIEADLAQSTLDELSHLRAQRDLILTYLNLAQPASKAESTVEPETNIA